MFDSRSLALFRICISLVFVIDILNRFQDLGAHYGSGGVLPFSVLFDRHWNEWYWSLYTVSVHPFWSGFLMVMTLGCALSMLFGWRTRKATVLLWILVVSLHNRNPIVLQGGDTMMRMLLFWSMFLPLGNVWSIDEKIRLARGQKKISGLSGVVQHIASVGFLIQIFSVYTVAGFMKLEQATWREGTGLYYALTSDQFSTRLATWILSRNWDLSVMNYTALGVELIGPLLILSPFAVKWCRMTAVLLFWSLHIGIMLTLHVGVFSLAGIAAWTIFIPPEVLSYLGKRRAFIWSAAAFNRVLERFSFQFKWDAAHSEADLKPEITRSGLVTQGFSLLLLIGVMLTVIIDNVANVPQLSLKKPEYLASIRNSLRLDQKWNMFARPFLRDGWLVIPALTRDGRLVDLWAKDRVLRETPAGSISSTFKRQRWRKYSMNLITKNYHSDRMQFARYLCRRWNDEASPESRIEVFQMIYMELSNKPGEVTRPAEPILLWKHRCRTGELQPQEEELMRKVAEIIPGP